MSQIEKLQPQPDVDLDVEYENVPPYTLEWLYNRQIVVIASIGVISFDVVDIWYNMIKRVVDEWPAERPLIMLFDSTKNKASMTPYQRSKVRALYGYRTDKKTFLAITMPKSHVAQVLRMILSLLHRPNAQINFVQSREDGLEWLVRVSKIKKDSKT